MLPPLALSVRQPWAWAIVAGHKPIENRTLGAIRSGGMDLRRIALHAAAGMTKKEYKWAQWRMAQVGVAVPRPEDLPRSAIIGAVTVTDIVFESESPWFGGPCGLVLEAATSCEPIPASGALGYFEWQPGGSLAKPAPWMLRYDRPSGDAETADLFGDVLSFQTPPAKPFGVKKR
ncbi:MAG: hypothetical protein AAGJ96_05760 [Pseudomonadota bacterium]